LLGNARSEEDVLGFYKDELVQRAWVVRSQSEHEIAFAKDERTNVQISDLYYYTTVAPHSQIQQWEREFPSLTYIALSRALYDASECRERLERIR
jgi:hypothetical protein